MSTMKAAHVIRYGGPEQVEWRDVEKPTPQKGEVLIRVVATTVNSADWRIRSLDVPRGYQTLMRLVLGYTGPRQPVLGTELAGVVEAVGPGVSAFRVGDEVVAVPGAQMGAHADYKVMPADGRVIKKPSTLSFGEASAMCFGGLTALHYLRAVAKMKAGERLLVIGASGAVGSAAIQIAHVDGVDVTAVCSASNRDLVMQLGATRVIDYVTASFTDDKNAYDVVLDCVGATNYDEVRAVLRDDGRFMRVVATLADEISSNFQGRRSRHRVVAGVSGERLEDMRVLAALAERGVYRPVIDSTLPFERIVDAHARVESRRKRGSIVLERVA